MYQNRNYNNRNNQQQQRNQEQYKRSGATYSKIKSGKNEGGTVVNAWKSTKMGLLTLVAYPVSPEIHTSEKGKEYLRYVATITNKQLGTQQTYWCLMNIKTKVLVIRELSMCVTPNGSGYTKSGKRVSGYFGKNYR